MKHVNTISVSEGLYSFYAYKSVYDIRNGDLVLIRHINVFLVAVDILVWICSRKWR